MPLSYQRYTADGNTKDFSVPFNYINRSHVFAKVNNDLVTHTWVNDSMLRLPANPHAGAHVWIYRVTPKEAPLTVFKDGVGFREADLNRTVLQLLYISQEAYENADFSLLAEWREETLLAMHQTLHARDEAMGYRDQCLALLNEAQSVLDAYAAEKIAELEGVVNEALGDLNDQIAALQAAMETMTSALGDAETILAEIVEQRRAAEAAVEAAGLHEITVKAYKDQAREFRDDTLDYRNQTETIRDTTTAYRNETAQIRDNTVFIKEQAEAAKIAAEAFKDETYDYLLQTISRWNESKGFRDEAETYRNEAAVLASAAAEAAATAFGAAAQPWQEGHVYNWPDVVAAPDGHTYRCIGNHVTSMPTHYNPDWQLLTVIPSVAFELDEDGNLMPALPPTATSEWKIDEDGNIMPR